MKTLVVAPAVCAAILCAHAASAQISRPERPYRGLFGPGSSDAAEVLSVSGSIGAGYETDVVVDIPTDDPILPGGLNHIRDATYGVFSGGLSYARDTEKVDLGGSLFSSGRYYPDVSGHVLTSHAAAVGASVNLTASTQVSASQTVVYQPWQVFTYFPALFAAPLGQAVVPNQDFSAGGSEYYSYASSAGISQQLSRRATLTAGYTYQFGDIKTDTGALSGDFEIQTAYVSFGRSITRTLGVRAGYRYSEARFSPERRGYRGDMIDAGVDYSRDLSVTRRTRLSFSTGANGVREQTVTRYGATGTATLTREIGRTWMAAGSYSRNVVFVESLRTPYFYDGVNVALNGLISRRVAFHSGAGATVGELGLTDADSGRFDTSYATAGLSYAISRHLAAGVDYVYYYYRFDPLSVYPEYGLAPRLARHGVRVALNAWAPIFERGRRRNATR